MRWNDLFEGEGLINDLWDAVLFPSSASSSSPSVPTSSKNVTVTIFLSCFHCILINTNEHVLYERFGIRQSSSISAFIVSMAFTMCFIHEGSQCIQGSLTFLDVCFLVKPRSVLSIFLVFSCGAV